MSASLDWLPWILALGWTLVHVLWQGVVIGLAHAAVRALLPKTHCHARYAAGLAALALLALWPVATFLALRPRAGLATGSGDALSSPLGTFAAGASAGFDAGIDALLPWLVSLWFVGVVVVGWRALRQWRELVTLTRRWAFASPELDSIMHAVNARFGFVRKVRVLVSARVDTPMLIGWIKPVVLLPSAVALGFPRQQLELILAHELGHLRRYDHLVNLAQAMLETVLFYHPVVHWISRDVRNERELCCDALVLRLTQGDPREYAHTLASLEELRQLPASFALAASGGELIERVRRIIGMPASRVVAPRQAQMRWLFAAALLGIGLVFALRIGREDARTLDVPVLSADWLASRPAATLPLATFALPFERPRLRLLPFEPVVATSVERGDEPAAPVPAHAVPALTPAVALRERVAPDASAARADATVMSPAVVAAPAAADLAPVPAAVAPAPAPVVSAPSVAAPRPVATRIVQPKFPSFARRPAGRVEASFAITPDGRVTDIRIVEGDAASSFARAAERALEQWRFDPASLRADASRYTQTFVFAPRGADAREECIKPTGSLVCRDPEESSTLIRYSPGR
ncbi:MAG: M56 family peptidase [Lysobacteraceae bacterium]|nr:MAG: M56 family peptidase [Xanthomonadaceae bacterium]